LKVDQVWSLQAGFGFEFPVTQSNFSLLLINAARSTVRMGLQALSNLMTGNDLVSTKVWPFIITESSLLG
jgi:hypothetical protein